MKLRAFLFALLFALSLSAQAATVRTFYDGFESYTAGQPLPSTNFTITPDSNGMSATVVTAAIDGGLGPPVGSKMFWINWHAGSSPRQTAVRFVYPSDWGGSDELFMRFRFRFDADCQIISGIHIFRSLMPGGGNDSYLGGQIDEQLSWFADMDAVNGLPFAANVFFNKSIWVSTGQFHELEIYYKRNAPTAFKLWVDDSLKINASGFDWSGAKFTHFDFASNWSGAGRDPPDNSNHVYIDEVEWFANVNWGLGFDEATDPATSMAAGDIAVSGGPSLPPTVLPFRSSQKDEGPREPMTVVHRMPAANDDRWRAAA